VSQRRRRRTPRKVQPGPAQRRDSSAAVARSAGRYGPLAPAVWSTADLSDRDRRPAPGTSQGGPMLVAGDNLAPVEQLGQPAQARLGVPERYQLARPTVDIHHADRTVILGPIHTSRPCRSRRRGGLVQTHRCLSLRYQWGSTWRFRDTTAGRIERRSMAHSPVASRGVPGRRASQNSQWTSRVERAGRWPDGHRCAQSLPDRARPWWTMSRPARPGSTHHPHVPAAAGHASWAWGSRRRAR
jgi:hypothetical protein